MSDKETSKYDEDIIIDEMEISTIYDNEIEFNISGEYQYTSTEQAKEIIKFLQHQIDKAK